MNPQKVLNVLSETLKHSESVIQFTQCPIHLEIFYKQRSIFNKIKLLLDGQPDKHEIFKLGTILIELYYIIENADAEPDFFH